MQRSLLVAAAAMALLAATALIQAGPKPAASGLDKDLENEVFAVFERGTRSADMEARATCVEHIGRVRPAVIKDYVVDALNDPQWIVRHAAIKALIKLGDASYRKTLGAAVADPTLYEKPGLSPLGLVLSLPKDEAVELLTEALVKTEGVRDIILKELFKKGSALARDYYEPLSAVPPVKAWVMNHLEVFADPGMYPLLVKTLPGLSKEELLKVLLFMETLDASYDIKCLDRYLKDKDMDIVEAAGVNLALRGDIRGLDIVIPMCDENEIPRQLRCLRALKGLASNEEVRERAKLFLYGDPDPDVLYAAYDIFTTAGDESVYDKILARLNSTNIGHRAASVYFIAKMKGNRALPELHNLLRDGSPLIRLRAAQAIGELRQAESVPYLGDALVNDADPAVKKELVKALGNIGDKSIIEHVSFLIFDPTVRHEAIEALTKVRHRDVIPTLRNVLQTQFSKEERTMALAAIIRVSPAEGFPVFKGCLGWIPEGFLDQMAQELKAEFVEYLRAALDSVNDEVRREAVLAFRWVGVDVELKVLESQLFSSNDTELRRLILARVVELKKDGAISILESFFNDKVKELRVEAIRLAGTIVLPGTETVTKLKTLLSEADEAIRVASAAALVLIYLGAW